TVAPVIAAGCERRRATSRKDCGGVGRGKTGGWRRRRDSNPGYRFWPVCSLSRGVPSTTRPRLRVHRKKALILQSACRTRPLHWMAPLDRLAPALLINAADGLKRGIRPADLGAASSSNSHSRTPLRPAVVVLRSYSGSHPRSIYGSPRSWMTPDTQIRATPGVQTAASAARPTLQKESGPMLPRDQL